MQKTLTIYGLRFTGKQIAAKFDKANMTNGGDYIVLLNGRRFYANYRQIQDANFAPVCSAARANAISLMPDNSHTWDIWVTL